MSDFFSRVKKNINKGIATVSEKSSLVIETTKIKGQIAKLEDQRNDLFQELGSDVYMAYRSDSLDEQLIAEKVAEIKAVEDAIVEKVEELEALTDADGPEPAAEESVPRCECGTELQPGAKFCLNCGKPVQVEEPVVEVEKCECGADLLPGMKFCMNCGKQLE